MACAWAQAEAKGLRKQSSPAQPAALRALYDASCSQAPGQSRCGRRLPSLLAVFGAAAFLRSGVSEAVHVPARARLCSWVGVFSVPTDMPRFECGSPGVRGQVPLGCGTNVPTPSAPERSGGLV